MRRAGAALGVLALATALVVEGATPVAPKVGGSATYRWTSSLRLPVSVLVARPGPGGQTTWSVAEESSTPSPVFVTYAVVRGDRKSYTLQIVTHDEAQSAPLSVTQITVDTASGKALRRVIRVPKGVIDTPESGFRPLREADVASGTREDVTVAAGRFSALRGTVQGAEVWVSDQVPAMALVKAIWPSGMLELVRSAPSGAEDLLATRKP